MRLSLRCIISCSIESMSSDGRKRCFQENECCDRYIRNLLTHLKPLVSHIYKSSNTKIILPRNVSRKYIVRFQNSVVGVNPAILLFAIFLFIGSKLSFESTLKNRIYLDSMVLQKIIEK